MFQQALRTAGFIGGTMVEEFEKAFANFCGSEHAIGSQQRHGCLALCHHGLRVQAGDVVVTVPNTFIATTEAISQAGAMPEFVDIDEHTYNMVRPSCGSTSKISATMNSSGGSPAEGAAVRSAR